MAGFVFKSQSPWKSIHTHSPASRCRTRPVQCTVSQKKKSTAQLGRFPLASPSRLCSSRLLLLIQNHTAAPPGGPVRVLLHPFQPHGHDSRAASSLSSIPVQIFLCNPISDSSHKGLHCQYSGFFCLSQLPLLVWAGLALWLGEAPPGCITGKSTTYLSGSKPAISITKTQAKFFRYSK